MFHDLWIKRRDGIPGDASANPFEAPAPSEKKSREKKKPSEKSWRAKGLMMDCREAKRLLPLWIGQDLPDAASMSDVAKHLENCSSCDQHRQGLQTSLEALQFSTAEAFSCDGTRRSVWPRVISRISKWESNQRRDRFNGWIPASVMAVAVALMVTVSIPSIQEEFFGDGANLANTFDFFDRDTVSPFDPLKEAQGQKLTPEARPVGSSIDIKRNRRPDFRQDEF
jgi:hypothetical protein